MRVGDRMFDLERLDAEELARIADRLRSAGYTEDSVRERLGLDDISAIRLDAYPYYLNDRLRRRDRLDVAIILFLLQGVVAVEELEPMLDKSSRKQLKEAGVLLGDRATRTYRASVSLYPVRDRLLFTDHRYRHMPWIRTRAPHDPVMFLSPESYWIARAAIRRRVRSALDLGTGCGVQAILAASHADRAVGTDTNPRAVAFARLNAMLNSAWNASFAEGDLFRPCGGERFDLIVANPPFVPSPVYEVHYRDGGPSGADTLRRVIAAIPDYLASSGIAQVITHLGERDGEGYLDRVRRWLNGANLNMHVLKVAESSAEEYALVQARAAPFGNDDYGKYAADVKAWIDNLRSQRFQRILSLILTFEWNDEGANPPWTREDEAKPPRRAIGAEIGRVLLAKRRARAPGALRTLDRCRAGIPDDIVLVERRRTTGHGFETKDFRVTFRDPALAAELEVKPLVRDLLERIDNRSTVPEIIGRYARDIHARVEDVDEKCRRAFLAMLERGLVTLDEIGAPVPIDAHARGSEIIRAEVLIGPPGQVPESEDEAPAPAPGQPVHAIETDPLAISGGEEKPPHDWQAPVEPAKADAPAGALDALAEIGGAAPPPPKAKPSASLPSGNDGGYAPPSTGSAGRASPSIDDEFGLADLDGIDDLKEDAPA